MKSNESNVSAVPHRTHGSVLDDLGFSAAEALEIKVKAEIYRDLLEYIRERQFTQAELCSLLGVYQPDVSNLLTGRVSKFSVSKLIKFAGKLNLEAKVKLTKPKHISLRGVAAGARSRQRVRAAAAK